jgi:hypothetical protein
LDYAAAVDRPGFRRRNIPKPHLLGPPPSWIGFVDALSRRHKLGDHAVAVRDQHGLAAGCQANVFTSLFLRTLMPTERMTAKSLPVATL